MANDDAVNEAVKLLEELKEQLPVGHHERPGVIRAIEVLSSYNSSWVLQRYDGFGWRNQLNSHDRPVTYPSKAQGQAQLDVYNSSSRHRFRLVNPATREIVESKRA